MVTIASAILVTCNLLSAQQIGERIVIITDRPIAVYDGDNQLGELKRGDIATFEGWAPNSALVRYRGKQVSVPRDSAASKKRAIKLLSEAIEKEPSAQDYAIRGRMHYNLQDFQQAHRDFDRSIELDQNNLWAHMYRGAAYEQQGMDELALQSVARAFKIDPKNPGLHAVRSALLEKKGDRDRSVADLKTAIELDPYNVVAHYNLAVERWSDDHELCKQSLKRVIEIEPYYHLGYFGLSQFYNTIENSRSDAIKRLDQAIELGIAHKQLLSSRAQLHKEAGHWSKHYADLATLAEHPNASQVDQSQGAWILATHPDDDYRDGQRAVRIAEKLCTDTQWKIAEHIQILACAYAEKGDFDRALQTLDRIEGPAESLEEMRQLFENGKPFRSEDERPIN